MFTKLKEKISKKFKTFPRSNEIDFPSATKGQNYTFKSESQGDNDDYLNINWSPVTVSRTLLNSGKILLSYAQRLEKLNGEFVSYLEIYSIPDLKLLQKYEFPWSKEGNIYRVGTALQLKNGNIFSIFDRYYTFKGEDIKNGPISESEKISSSFLGKDTNVEFIEPLTKKKYYRL